MKYIAIIGSLIGMALLMSGCAGEVAEVPPAKVGKVLTKNGFQPETIPPSKFRLPMCLFYCDKLITADASDQGIKEAFTLYMPKDQLTMKFDVRAIVRIKNDESSINNIFNRIPAQNQNIPIDAVYQTYVKPIIRNTVRAVMADYTINEVASSRAAVDMKIAKSVKESLKNSPMQVARIGLADIQFPDLITKQKEITAQRKIEIEQEEAKKQIRLVKLETELKVAQAERNIRRVKAEAAKEENAIFAQSVNEKYLAYKKLEVLEALAKNPNAVFVPFGALDELGLSQKIFASAKTN